MTPERFWQLVGLLDGVAEDESCARLHALIRSTGEGSAFTEMVDDHVDALVMECRWPDDFAGSDVMNWVGGAVVAAGEASCDAVRAEAEALLVVGFEMTEEDQAKGPPPDHGEPVSPVAVTLQWLSIPSPCGRPLPA